MEAIPEKHATYVINLKNTKHLLSRLVRAFRLNRSMFTWKIYSFFLGKKVFCSRIDGKFYRLYASIYRLICCCNYSLVFRIYIHLIHCFHSPRTPPPSLLSSVKSVRDFQRFYFGKENIHIKVTQFISRNWLVYFWNFQFVICCVARAAPMTCQVPA